jgi:hypothetical protein
MAELTDTDIREQVRERYPAAGDRRRPCRRGILSSDPIAGSHGTV